MPDPGALVGVCVSVLVGVRTGVGVGAGEREQAAARRAAAANSRATTGSGVRLIDHLMRYNVVASRARGQRQSGGISPFCLRTKTKSS